jgi:hypothetical protein
MTKTKKSRQHIKLNQQDLQLLDEGYKDIETQEKNYKILTGAEIGSGEKNGFVPLAEPPVNSFQGDEWDIR